MRTGIRPCGVALVVLCFSGATWSVMAQEEGADAEWRSYSADLAATKYSPLDQIDAENVTSLTIEWTRRAVDQSILDQADVEATARRTEADGYAQDVMYKLEQEVATILATIRRGIEALEANRGASVGER